MKKGFTLIELLVVISIISLLSSIVFASLNNARDRGRDAALVSEMTQFSRAMALYRLNNNGDSYAASGIYLDEQVSSTGLNAISLALSPYINPLPLSDESVAVDRNFYCNGSTTSTFCEGDSDPQTNMIRFASNDGNFNCLTSLGIHSEVSEGDNGTACEQR